MAAILEKLINSILKSPEVKRIVFYCLSTGSVVSSATVAGGFLMGPLGLFIGAAGGGTAAALIHSGRFRSILNVLPSIVEALRNGISTLTLTEIINLITKIIVTLGSNIDLQGLIHRPMVQ